VLFALYWPQLFVLADTRFAALHEGLHQQGGAFTAATVPFCVMCAYCCGKGQSTTMLRGNIIKSEEPPSTKIGQHCFARFIQFVLPGSVSVCNRLSGFFKAYNGPGGTIW